MPSIFPFPTKKKSLPRRKLIRVSNKESSEEIQDSNPETDDTGSTSEWNVNKSVEPVQSENNAELKEELVDVKQMSNEAKLDLRRMLEGRHLVLMYSMRSHHFI